MRQEQFEKDWEPPKLEHLVPTKWGWVVSYPRYLVLGKYVDIGFGTYIQARYGVHIKDRVHIGSHCAIYSESTINDQQGKIILGEGCKIGSHSIIMPGVTIGKNAVVGAGSYIDTPVPDDTLVKPDVCKVVRRLDENDRP